MLTIAHRGAHRLASDHARQPYRPHQPSDRAAGDIEALPLQLPPDLADTIDPEVGLEHAPHLDCERSITPRPRRQAQWIPSPRDMSMVG